MSGLDQVLGFSLPDRDARGRVARIGPVLEDILSAHGYPPVIEALLADALVLAALLGSTLAADNGQMTLQAQTEGGAVELLVCDYRGGELRGYVKHDAVRIAAMPRDATLPDLFGKGYLAITFDQATSGERYQGIVPLEGASLADAVEHYFEQSEQIPTIVRTALAGEIAGGFLLQHLPEGETGRERLHVRIDRPAWDHVTALGTTVSPEEMTDPELPLRDLIWRLFHEEDRLLAQEPVGLSKGCRCDVDHVRSVIIRFPEDERAAMAQDDGTIAVDCAFCSKVFAIPKSG